MKQLKKISASVLTVLLTTIIFAETTSKKENPNLEKKWWKEAICYEIYVRSFKDSNGDGIGDLNGITEELGYLKSLGIDVVWITPFYPSPGIDMGYDVSDYKNVDPKFGTLKDFDNLIKKAHEKGIKVILDMVFSHTSDQHRWFKEAVKSKNNPYRNFYVFAPPKDGSKPPNDWQSWFSGPAWEYSKDTEEYYLHIFAVQQPALNWKTPKVRKELAGVAKFWLDRGADGLRFDVITLIALPKFTQSDSLWGTMPKVHTYLKKLNKDVLSKYDILTVGEMPGVNYENAWKYVGAEQKQLETIFQLDIMAGIDNKDGNKFQPAPMDLLKFKNVYENWYDGLYGKGWNSVVLGNHDQARAVSRWGNDKQYWKESAKMLCTFLLTQWGTPYIYEGDEIGMTNCNFTKAEFRDVEAINFYNAQLKEGKQEIEFLPGLLARNRDNARTPMQWNEDKNAGFSTADKTWIKVNPDYKTINVAEEEKDADSILNYYKKMIRIKKDSPALTYGTYKQIDPKNKQVYAYTRVYNDEEYLIVLNFKDGSVSFDTSVNGLDNCRIINNNYKTAPEINKNGTIKLRPYEAVIVKTK